jgi:hypothetical protein
MLCLSHYLLFINKIVEQVSAQKPGGGEAGREDTRTGEVPQTMYTHVNKCKNDKLKEKNLLSQTHQFTGSICISILQCVNSFALFPPLYNKDLFLSGFH